MNGEEAYALSKALTAQAAAGGFDGCRLTFFKFLAFQARTGNIAPVGIVKLANEFHSASSLLQIR